MDMSSPVSIWMILNQMQLLILLTLLKCGLPKDVVDYILGNKFALFSFDMLPAKDMTHSGYIMDRFEMTQVHEEL